MRENTLRNFKVSPRISMYGVMGIIVVPYFFYWCADTFNVGFRWPQPEFESRWLGKAARMAQREVAGYGTNLWSLALVPRTLDILSGSLGF